MGQEKIDRLLAALMTAPTLTRAAEQAGIPYGTAKKLLAKPEAQARLAEMRQQAAKEAVLEAANLARLARETLATIMADEGAPAHARVRAAEASLNYERAVAELFDIHERLAAIEAKLAETAA